MKHWQTETGKGDIVPCMSDRHTLDFSEIGDTDSLWTVIQSAVSLTSLSLREHERRLVATIILIDSANLPQPPPPPQDPRGTASHVCPSDA